QNDRVAPQKIVIITQGSPVGQFFNAGCNGPTFCEEILQQLGVARPETHAATLNFREELFRLGSACAGPGECVCPGQASCNEDCSAPGADNGNTCTRQTIGISRLPMTAGQAIDVRQVRNTERRLMIGLVDPPCSEEHPVATW